MASQFGRKAVARPVGAAAPAPSSDIAAKRAAFIAAERAQREAEGHGPHEAAPTVTYVPAGPFYVRDKSMGLAYVLWFLLGGLSVHRFYLGYATSGAIQLFLRLGGAAIILGGGRGIDPAMAWLAILMILAGSLWMLFDAFLIPGMVRQGSGGRPTEAARIFA